MIRLCMFDLDGTLSNTLESIAFFGNQALKQCGYPTIESLDAFRYLVGHGADTLMRGMLKTVTGSFSEEAVKKLRHAYDQAYRAEPDASGQRIRWDLGVIGSAAEAEDFAGGTIEQTG